MQLKTTKSRIKELIKEELKQIIAEKNGAGALMMQSAVDETPEVVELKPKLEGLKERLGVVEVFYELVEPSSDEGFKLISVQLKVPSVQSN